ncbi:MAG: hypothetical protein HYZ75_15380 [Elusimicrobia bacterium]|nr:hypothetical protein [Elusimicrobiota bacterium]
MISRERAIALLVTVCVLAMTASLLPPFSSLISLAANNVYPYTGPDIHLDYFMGAFLGLLCGFILLVSPIPRAISGTVIFCWALKLAAALFLVPVYEFYYGLDIDGYFFFSFMPEKPIITSSGNIGTWHIRVLAWLLFQVIGPSFHGGKVVFSFMGFLGIYLTYRGAVRFMKQEKPILLILTTLAPTCLFWSSTLGKDPIILFAIGVYTHGCLALFSDYRKRHILEIAAGIFMASFVRSYFLPIMAIPLAIAYLTQTRRPVVRLLIFPVVLMGVFYSLTAFSEHMKIDSFDAFSAYQSKVASNWKGGSSFALPLIDSPIMLLMVAPLAVFTALFRPTLFEAHNAFSLAAALDNTFLLVLFFYAWSRSRMREFFQTAILWMGCFVVIWSIMYGVGTGNLGAISRFKIQVLPIFITVLFYMARKRTTIRVAAP